MPVDWKNLEPEEKLKYEVAEELGTFRQSDAGRVENADLKRNRKNRRIGNKEKETGGNEGRNEGRRVNCTEKRLINQSVFDTIVRLGSGNR